jgi:uncharacterized protein
MIKPGKKIAGILSIFCVLFIFFSSAYAQNHKNFLWTVQSKTNTVYILGSIHFMKKEIYPLDKKIEDAFDKSDVLSVEANVNDISRIDLQKLMETSLYSGDDNIEKHVSGETYRFVKKEIERNGIPAWIADKQRPWILALTLTSLELLKLGFNPEYGIDMHFLSKASGKKKIKELESVNYQINLLSGFSDKEQEAFLLYTLKDLNLIEKEVDTALRAWTTGDAKGMESIMGSLQEDRGMSSMYEKLIYERNRNMAAKIEEYLKTKETYFVVVGAGHIVGEKGIIEILRRKGYHVAQL